MPQKLAAISVDLDEIDCYTAIHGLDPQREGVPAHVVYDRALPRLTALFDELAVPATFFAIGRDLTRPENAARLRALHQAGHEIANHSLHHYYDLTRRSIDEQRREVEGGADAIEAAVGARPVGFRAPGYTITDSLFRALEASGAVYDSSVFPCPAYYMTKTAAIAWIGLRGRKSRSVVDTPRVLLAPADPYPIGTPYYRRGSGILEIPIGVTGNASGRLPFIGTSVVLSSPSFARRLTALATARAFVNLELHGIDLADAQEDGLTRLAAYQPDLRRSAAAKRAALRVSLETLRERGYQFVTLRKATRLLR